MLKLTASTKDSPGDVVKKAVSYFLPEGLKVTAQTGDTVNFEGGGGYVQLKAYTDGKNTSVDMETREWEYQVKEFAQKIK